MVATDTYSMDGGANSLPMLQKVGVDAWLRAHGKLVRPELTKKQKQELKECFDLIDADGSGAIDAEELLTAFNVLGMRVKKAEVEKMLAEVDADGSGEKMRRAQARRKLETEEPLPEYVVEQLDDELKQVILQSCEDIAFQKEQVAELDCILSNKKSFLPKSMALLSESSWKKTVKHSSGHESRQEMRPMSLNKQIYGFHKQELAELGQHRTRVGYTSQKILRNKRRENKGCHLISVLFSHLISLFRYLEQALPNLKL